MMKYLGNKLLLITMLLLLGACSSNHYVVTFDSYPQAATVICNGKNWGYTPISLYYDESLKEHTFLNASSCSANWASGAKTNYPADVKVFPDGASLVSVSRPDSEGYSVDTEFASKIKKQREAEATEYNKDNATWFYRDPLDKKSYPYKHKQSGKNKGE